MKAFVKTGLTFGLTSGVITTLGLMVGLHAGTHSVVAVIGGIITIAVADAMSDALGMHISKESEAMFTAKQVWITTAVTFLTKFAMALTFAVPLLIFELNTAIWVGLGWGLIVLTILSYIIAREQNTSPTHVIAEHLAIAGVVIVATHFLGDWIGSTLGSVA